MRNWKPEFDFQKGVTAFLVSCSIIIHDFNQILQYRGSISKESASIIAYLESRLLPH